MTPRVFVSHASEDKTRFVVTFAQRLRENGVDAWLDQWEMRPGDSLVDRIFEHGLKEAQAVVIVLSSVSVRWLPGAVLLLIALGLAPPELFAEREFRVYRSLEAQADVDLPPDYQVPGEFVIGRLMYPTSPDFRWFGFGGNWREGGTTWAVDYPRADRHFAKLLKRLTRVNVRSVEQPVNLDDGDDVFDWPFLMVGLPGMWDLTGDQAKKLREYLLRGGFLFCDSFFGTQEWAGFVNGMQRVFPDRPIVDLPDDHPIFHTVYDLNARLQVPNWNALQGGVPYRADGVRPHWRAVLDEDGRVMVAIAFNNDVGDSWQWADDPDYPQEGASLGMRMGVNFAVYAMTH